MKSGKQRKTEIKAARLVAATRREAVLKRSELTTMLMRGGVVVDVLQISRGSTFDVWPKMYVDYAFICRDCSAPEVWTAAQQKWWFEVAHGPFGTRAVRCRACRVIERARVQEARRVSEEGRARKVEMQKAAGKLR